MHPRDCPVCRNSKMRKVPRCSDYSWELCNRCATWKLGPQKIAKAYPREYYGESSAKFSGWAQRLRARFHHERARLVARWLSQKSGMIYDVGCGDGLFLQEIARLGKKVAGFEPETVPRKQAENRLRKPIDQTLFHSLAKRKAAGITCWQVIEHLKDPQGFLQTCRQNLEEGGLLALSTVNSGSIQANFFGVKWLHLDPPRHLWVSTMENVAQMVQSAGFQVIQVRYNPLEFGPIGWVDSLFNLADPQRDRLLSVLKQGCHHPKDRLAWWCAGLLTPLAIVLCLVEAGFHRPATFEIYARMTGTRARRQGG